MRKLFLKLLVSIITVLWIIYFIQTYIISTEPFTNKIQAIYRPYVRAASHNYNTFIGHYGPDAFFHKIKKWGF
jgi:hypothetical protein